MTDCHMYAWTKSENKIFDKLFKSIYLFVYLNNLRAYYFFIYFCAPP